MLRAAIALLILGAGLGVIGFALGYAGSSALVEASSIILLVAVPCVVTSFVLLVAVGIRSLATRR